MIINEFSKLGVCYMKVLDNHEVQSVSGGIATSFIASFLSGMQEFDMGKTVMYCTAWNGVCGFVTLGALGGPIGMTIGIAVGAAYGVAEGVIGYTLGSFFAKGDTHAK